MLKFFNNIWGSAKAITRRMERQQASIVFAEAGCADTVNQENQEMAEASSKLLVVGNESVFSSHVIDYAVDMARRMSFEIVALNTAPLSCNSLKSFSASQKKLCQEFREIAEKEAQRFRQTAEAEGLTFRHVVKYCDHDQAIEEVQQETADIEFVISDMAPQINAESEQSRDAKRPNQQVYVYSML